jgi:hypothetical protein
VATGFRALRVNSAGSRNYAAGSNALAANTASDNTATGHNALAANTSGSANVADGGGALGANVTGVDNVATGFNSLRSNTSGRYNVATGRGTLANNTSGESNTALGYAAGYNTTGSNNVSIANQGVAGESGRVRIGTPGLQTATFVAGIDGATIGGPAKPVLVNANGRLGTEVSGSALSRRGVKSGFASDRLVPALQPTAHLRSIIRRQNRRLARQGSRLRALERRVAALEAR